VIDSDYRGEIKVLLANQGQVPFKINPGDKIAQLICEKVSLPDTKEIMDLPDTIRGDHGFGSSGKF
jgi:dUTP pyrophosphatase